MNAEGLARKLLSEPEYREMSRALELLKARQYEILYNGYGDTINAMLLVDSYDEFVDWLNDSEASAEEAAFRAEEFIVSFLRTSGKGADVGGWEGGLQDKLGALLKAVRSDSSEGGTGGDLSLQPCIRTLLEQEIFTDFDGEDNFRDCVLQLNELLDPFGLKLVVFFSDNYWAAGYFIILVARGFAEGVLKDWSDKRSGWALAWCDA